MPVGAGVFQSHLWSMACPTRVAWRAMVVSSSAAVPWLKKASNSCAVLYGHMLASNASHSTHSGDDLHLEIKGSTSCAAGVHVDDPTAARLRYAQFGKVTRPSVVISHD